MFYVYNTYTDEYVYLPLGSDYPTLVSRKYASLFSEDHANAVLDTISKRQWHGDWVKEKKELDF